MSPTYSSFRPEKEGVGPAFIYGEYLRLSDITDGTSNTIFAIQLVKHTKPWASPESLTVDQAFDLIQNEDRFFSKSPCSTVPFGEFQRASIERPSMRW